MMNERCFLWISCLQSENLIRDEMRFEISEQKRQESRNDEAGR
jgi:hypothetical protein